MHIAIIIPAFNVASFLHDAVVSVLAQTHADWSVVIIDDGSTDATSAVAAAFHDPRITLLRQANAGVSAARNAGLAHVLGLGGQPPWRACVRPDALLFLDGDDWLARDALAWLAHTLNDAPWAVAACGRFARVAPDRTTRVSRCPPDGDVLEQLLTRNLFANGGHLLIRREAIEAAGEFRTTLSYGEDWEYCARVALLGEFAAVPHPKPVLFVRERPGSAYLANAADPQAYAPALEAIFHHPGIIDRVGQLQLETLRRRAAAETAWAVGRELIRHGRFRDGQRWLTRSIRDAPSLKRLFLMGLACFRCGPFRAYQSAG